MRRCATAILAAVLVAITAPASASIVSLQDPQGVDVYKGESYTAYRLVITAGPGEANVVWVGYRHDYRVLVVSDEAGITAGGGCQATADPTQVRCPKAIDRLAASLGNGDDQLRSDLLLSDGSAAVSGGPGADTLGPVYGGRETLLGDEGDDILVGAGGKLVGGEGADVLIGPGTADYARREAGVTVSADGRADDGAVGEGDNVMPGVTSARGGNGDDVLIGSPNGDVLVGGPGCDRLEGRGGADRLLGGEGADEILGGPGDDEVVGYVDRDWTADPLEEYGPAPGHDGRNRMDAGAGDDDVIGGPLADAITGGPGSDYVDGRSGGDFIDARDGVHDRITCSPGASEGGAALDVPDLVRGCAAVQRDGATRPRILLAGQTDTDPDGMVRVVLACSQDQPGGCRGTLRLSGRGRTLASRSLTIRPGRAVILSPIVRVKDVFDGCRTARVVFTFAGSDSAGAPATTKLVMHLTSTALRCNPRLLSLAPGDPWRSGAGYGPLGL